MSRNSIPTFLQKFGLDCSHEQMKIISNLFKELHHIETIAYPWANLEKWLESHGEKSLKLCGYGSLMNSESAARTISSNHIARQHGIAFGGIRIYEYQIPDKIMKDRYKTKYKENETAALNVRRDQTGVFNCVLITINSSDFNQLREREKDYELTPVVFCPWQFFNPKKSQDKNSKKNKPFLAFTLSCPQNSSFVNHDISPHLDYHELCCRGALEHSLEFLNCFLETTYLSDATTTIR